jgi:hypothetical protein
MTDKEQAVAVREGLFRSAAEGKVLVAGMHLCLSRGSVPSGRKVTKPTPGSPLSIHPYGGTSS